VRQHYERGLLVDELCAMVQQLLGQARVVEG